MKIMESKLTENQILFKQYLERCVRNEPCLIGDVINCEMYRRVGRIAYGLTDEEMEAVVD
jgi:hypothetical protein